MANGNLQPFISLNLSKHHCYMLSSTCALFKVGSEVRPHTIRNKVVDFPYRFKKIIVRYKKIGYNIDVSRQTACLVVNPIKVNSFAYLFTCTTVGRASD